QSVFAGHVDVADHDVELLLAQQLPRVLGVRGLPRAMPDFLQRHRGALANADVVVDDEHARHHAPPNVTRKSEPPRSFASTVALPPCHFATSATNDSPSPRPSVPAADAPRKKR